MNFTRYLRVRIHPEQYRMITEILAERPDLFQNRSHVVRAAVIRLHKELSEGHKL